MSTNSVSRAMRGDLWIATTGTPYPIEVVKLVIGGARLTFSGWGSFSLPTPPTMVVALVAGRVIGAASGRALQTEQFGGPRALSGTARLERASSWLGESTDQPVGFGVGDDQVTSTVLEYPYGKECFAEIQLRK